jgi:hypothetical protein
MRSRWIGLLAASVALATWSPAARSQEGGGVFGVPTSRVTPVPTLLAQGGLALPPASGTDRSSSAVTYDSKAYPQPSYSGGGGWPAQPTAPVASDRPDHFTPYMLGDFTGPLGSLFSDLKVAEGNSPRPVDRFFFDFSYYNNLARTRFVDPTASLRHVDLYRYVFGFEKTFLDEWLSVTVRVPFFTVDAESRDFVVVPGGPGFAPAGPSFTSTDLGNVSAIFKGVLWEDKATGSLISAGLTMSVPTASSRLIDPGPGTLAYVQPFVGFILSSGDFFLQGFSSITMPVARPESILLFNDIGVGYFIYRDQSGSGMVRSIAPTFEVHIMDPLRQVDPTVDIFGLTDKLRLANVVDLTLGTTIEFSNRSTLAVGVCTPVTGPKPFDVEAIAQFNFRF